MTSLVIGLVAFLGIHSISIVAPDWRDRTAKRVGANAWRAIYSIISIAGFILLIWGYGKARQQPVLLYPPPAWSHHATALLMLPVFPLILAAYVPGRIRGAIKHPMIVGVAVWALAHLISNGTLADLLLFGGFLAWAIMDRVSFNWRTARPIHTAPPSKLNDLIAVVTGLMLYVTFAFWLHIRWIGVSPLPL